MLLSSSLVDYIRSENRLTTCLLNLLTEGIKLAQLITKGSCLTASIRDPGIHFFWGKVNLTKQLSVPFGSFGSKLAFFANGEIIRCPWPAATSRNPTKSLNLAVAHSLISDSTDQMMMHQPHLQTQAMAKLMLLERWGVGGWRLSLPIHDGIWWLCGGFSGCSNTSS
jgi:hypothetical protein